ncbi:hypothetical protein V6N11_021898 [Hibiscus sabdariffa]|uniref:Uncharacterized protein n=1 Tax=Hibiscus sabdariffa TaxID=183260 RepID=A0ABR2THK6_9ROSI
MWNIWRNRNVVAFDGDGNGAASMLCDSRRLTQSCCSTAAVIGNKRVRYASSMDLEIHTLEDPIDDLEELLMADIG